MLSSNEIRKRFLDYFEKKEHTLVPSDPLVPSQDPTLLFTTAGMVQFKSLYAGAPLSYKRAVSCQKCLRAGGKGSDLENVGKTLRHHTFFEMLGNFSFGDYFKKEAIQWGWEFLTEELQLPQKKLWVSVFSEDDEAYEIWVKEVGLAKNRVVRLGEKDNFWGPAGESGACGPSSEIYIDLGAKKGCAKLECQPGCDCERYLEIWNLVFPQFFQEKDGSRRPLERCGIDTGMGLERLTFAVQGVENNYQTDLFKPLIDCIGQHAARAYSDQTQMSYHVIADHIRALVFAIADDVVPSNEGRGYVLRRILRRASRYCQKIGFQGASLHLLVPTVVELMKETYPALKDQARIVKLIKIEEERFLGTLSFGLSMLEELIRASEGSCISGEDLFRLHDTYGFPLEMAREVAEEEGFDLDEEGFNHEMSKQKERARANWSGKNVVDEGIQWEEWKQKVGTTKFLGYENILSEGKILGILKEGQMVQEAEVGDKVDLLLDRSPFYGTSGGQVGDCGKIKSSDGWVEISVAQWPVAQLTLHRGQVSRGLIRVGDPITAHVDEKLRQATTRHHTATHLLNYALRKILGDHVRQSGSLLDAEHLRFDFAHFTQTDPNQINSIEELINEKIIENKIIETKVLPIQEALDSGAIAFFGDKYGDQVRVIDIGGYHRELCGGTHVKATGEIGLFRILNESSISSGIRRIEAVSGIPALHRMQKTYETLDQLCGVLSASPRNALGRIEKLFEEKKSLENKLDKYQQSKVIESVRELKPKEIGKINLYMSHVGEVDAPLLKTANEYLKKKIESGVVFLAGHNSSRVFLLCSVTQDLVQKGVHAGKIIAQVAKGVGGGGGGKADLAQAGGKEPEKLEAALKEVSELIRKMS